MEDTTTPSSLITSRWLSDESGEFDTARSHGEGLSSSLTDRGYSEDAPGSMTETNHTSRLGDSSMSAFASTPHTSPEPEMSSTPDDHPAAEYIRKVPTGKKGVKEPYRNMCALAGFPPESKYDYDQIAKAHDDFEKARKNEWNENDATPEVRRPTTGNTLENKSRQQELSEAAEKEAALAKGLKQANRRFGRLRSALKTKRN
ncbi:hypothetical protein MKZ38_003894 [Zalerion maritima]|uniref:Uncharacterized protein n=1 Tax=Zalerion maritima TaxID=339359 RepID=A0AAD5RY76_9PEZI|nr:hypothetical protein MKZ38_003894 [Zalerion maritima]